MCWSSEGGSIHRPICASGSKASQGAGALKSAITPSQDGLDHQSGIPRAAARRIYQSPLTGPLASCADCPARRSLCFVVKRPWRWWLPVTYKSGLRGGFHPSGGSTLCLLDPRPIAPSFCRVRPTSAARAASSGSAPACIRLIWSRSLRAPSKSRSAAAASFFSLRSSTVAMVTKGVPSSRSLRRRRRQTAGAAPTYP